MLYGRIKGHFGSSVDFHTDVNRSSRRLMHFTCWMFSLKPSHAIIASWGNRVWMVHQIRCSNNNAPPFHQASKENERRKMDGQNVLNPLPCVALKRKQWGKAHWCLIFHSSRMSVVFMWYKGVQQIQLSGYMHCKDFWEMHHLSKCSLPNNNTA